MSLVDKLSQEKLFDSKRSQYRMGQISDDDFKILVDKFKSKINEN